MLELTNAPRADLANLLLSANRRINNFTISALLKLINY